MAVTNNIRKIRKEKGLYQKDLAVAIGVCPKSICNIEQEKYCPSLEMAMRLAKYLEVSMETLFSIDDFE